MIRITVGLDMLAEMVEPAAVSVTLYGSDGAPLHGQSGIPVRLAITVGRYTIELPLTTSEERRAVEELLTRVHVATAYAYQRVTERQMPACHRTSEPLL